jgi:hypothetical protein
MKHYKLSYEELAKQGRRYYNDANFCTVIALAVACDLPFGKAYHTYKRLGRDHRRGTYRETQHEALSNFKKVAVFDIDKTAMFRDRTVNQLLKHIANWKGRYWVYVNGHVIAIRDGVCEDWTALERACRRKVIDVYQIK